MSRQYTRRTNKQKMAIIKQYMRALKRRAGREILALHGITTSHIRSWRTQLNLEA